MADSGTLKEFLVSLGWNTNETQQRKFVDALEGATLRAKLLGDALEEVARKAAAMVGSVADSFDKLYFSSQRTGASVALIKDFSYAVSQMGGSADAARSSLENMAQKLRENPGYITYLNQLGFGLNKVTGQLERQHDLAVRAAQMPLSRAEIYAREVGMDERTLLANRQVAELERNMAEGDAARRRLGMDPEQAAKDANDFMTVWRRVANELDAIADDLLIKLGNALVGPFKEFDKFVQENGPAIGKAIDEVTKAIGEMTKAWVDDFEAIIKDPSSLNNFQKGMHSLAEDVAWLADKFHGFVADLRWINDQGNAAANVLNRFMGLPTVGRDSGAGSGSGDNQGIVKQLNDENDSAPGSASGGITGWWKRTAPTWLGGSPVGGGATGGGGGTRASGTLATNQQEAYTAARASGLSDTAAKALVANMSGESLANPSNNHWDVSHMSQGIVQWDPARSERIKQQFGKYPKNMSVADQTKAAIWEMQNDPAYAPTWNALQGNDAGNMINHLVRNYENPADKEGEIAKRSGLYRGLNVGEDASGGALVFGDSIGQGVMGALHTGGAAKVGASGDWVLDHIKGYSGDLAGKRIILSSGASNSGNPQKLSAQIEALKARGVNPKDITVLGVGNRADFAGFNDTLKGIAQNSGASFSPIGNTPGGVHPDDYGRVARDALAARPMSSPVPTLRAPTSPYGGLSPFVSPGPLGGGISQGDTTHINAPQHTEIHIDGSGDPTAVAHMVGANQGRVAADMARNLQGATN